MAVIYSQYMTSRVICLPITAATLLLACTLGACRSHPVVERILTPVHMEFEELFALEDTIRLDTAVLIGSISMLDVNSAGDFLVQDNQSESIHVFSPSGAYRHALSITDCNPEAEFGFSAQSTFLDNSQVLVLASKGAIVFDRAGQCVQISSDPHLVTNTWSVCSHRDTIFAMPRGIGDSTYIRAYSPDLALIDQFLLPAPRFPRLVGISLPYQGRTMACFSDDTWWIYGESFDATSRLRRAGLTQFMPEFYRKRTEDLPDLPRSIGPSNFQEVGRIIAQSKAQASYVQGLFALDEATRLVLFSGIENDNEAQRTGALIASHEANSAGVTTLFSGFPRAAKHGMLYFSGDLDERQDGELSNPTIIRYRFILPDITDRQRMPSIY